MGFDMAKIGFRGRPEPVVAWDKGRPRILYGRDTETGETSADRSSPASAARRRAADRDRPNAPDAVSRLEQEIKMIEQEVDDPMRGFNVPKRMATQSQLRRLRRRLRVLEPAQPWAGYGDED
jgi:hypothetical protein